MTTTKKRMTKAEIAELENEAKKLFLDACLAMAKTKPSDQQSMFFVLRDLWPGHPAKLHDNCTFMHSDSVKAERERHQRTEASLRDEINKLRLELREAKAFKEGVETASKLMNPKILVRGGW